MSAFRVRLLFGLALAVSALVVAPQELLAEDSDADQWPAAQLQQREKQRALETVTRLRLSPAQARRLLPIADRAAALRVAHYEWEATRLPEAIAAFTAFAAEDAQGQGFTPEVERRAAKASRELKEKREQLAAAIIGLEKEAAKYLTDEQRQVLDVDRRRHHDRGPTAGDADRLAQARQQLADLLSTQHPAPGAIGRRLLHPAAGAELARIAGVATPANVQRALDVLANGTPACPRPEFERAQAEVQRLRDEINNWNLINGLNFTVEQMQRIIALYDQYAKPAGPRQRRQQIVALEQAVSEVLNDGQREVLRTYKPCLVPPRNLKDPVRVGQANDSSYLERWLERARQAPSERLARLADELLDHEAERHGSLNSTERQKRKALLIRTARRAAALSEVDFALQQGALAEQIAPADRAQMLRDEIDILARDRGQPGVVARFLLRPAFMEQLRQRLTAITDPPVTCATETSGAAEPEKH